MNEAETRAELIDPKLKACDWGFVESSKGRVVNPNTDQEIGQVCKF